jgi:hypothetical protein
MRLRDGTGLAAGAIARSDGGVLSFSLQYSGDSVRCTTGDLAETQQYGDAFTTQACSDGCVRRACPALYLAQHMVQPTSPLDHRWVPRTVDLALWGSARAR